MVKENRKINEEYSELGDQVGSSARSLEMNARSFPS